MGVEYVFNDDNELCDNDDKSIREFDRQTLFVGKLARSIVNIQE